MTIKQKQCLLYYLGYYVGEVDGDWGTLSKTATKAFQKDFGGLTVDGVIGDATEKALKHAVCYGLPTKKTETKKEETKTESKKEPTKSGDWWDDIEFFEKSEFACKCGGKYCKGYPAEINQTLVKVADRVRKNFDAPVTVSSGLRCATHNANVGGVSGSRHKLGKAMDFCVKGKTSAQILAYVRKQPEIRYSYAINDTYVHMDVN